MTEQLPSSSVDDVTRSSPCSLPVRDRPVDRRRRRLDAGGRRLDNGVDITIPASSSSLVSVN